MSSLNRIILVGTISTDPDLKATTAGDSLLRFSLVVDRPNRQDGLPAQTDTIQVVAWRATAESGKTLKKGDVAYVEGKIVTRNYENNEGQKIYITEVEASDISSITASSTASFTDTSTPKFDAKSTGFQPAVDAGFEPVSSLEMPIEHELNTSSFDFGAPTDSAVFEPEESNEVPF